MKTRIAILACILVALAGLSIIVPATTRATLETKACPGNICIINSAKFNQMAPTAADQIFMCNEATEGCVYCCNYCLGVLDVEKIIGKAQYCGCQVISDYNYNCDTK